MRPLESANVTGSFGGKPDENHQNPDIRSKRRHLSSKHLRSGPIILVIVLKRTLTVCLHALASLCLDRDKPEEAQTYAERSLAITREKYGAEHPNAVTTLQVLAAIHADQHDHAEALRVMEQALDTGKKTLGTEHPIVATCLTNFELFP